MNTSGTLQVGDAHWVLVDKITWIVLNCDHLEIYISGSSTSLIVDEKYAGGVQRYFAGVLDLELPSCKRKKTTKKDLTEEINLVGFRECPDCSAKPGAYVLCHSCLTNRNSIKWLKEKLKEQLG